MAGEFDSAQLMELGWRQGALLGQQLALLAWSHAPQRVGAGEQDHLVVTSHDCDILNSSLAKESLVEVLRARVSDSAAGQRSHDSAGRNPRALRLSEVMVRGDAIALDFSVHDRWEIPRELLMEEPPAARLPDRERRLMAEWLAKRYIRAAFPTAFDARWRGESKAWRKLLKRHSHGIQGVYLRLDTHDELAGSVPYRCDLLLASPAPRRKHPAWATTTEAIEREFEEFWDRLRPGIACDTIRLHTVDRITLADLEAYQRFDADWVSFEDESPVVSVETDLRS